MELTAFDRTAHKSSLLQLPFSRFTLTFQGQVEAEYIPLDPRAFQAVRILQCWRCVVGGTS